jgi:2-phospho-L-lactate guanylyltransferase
MISAVVPVKTLAASKSRLLPECARSDVERLALAMMADVIEALRGVPALRRVVVVTPDAAVARAAEAAGADALLRSDPGLNPSVEAASAEVALQPEDGVLVVLGDVAAAAPEDLATLLDAVGTRGVALAPSSDGGTAALVRVPFDVIPARFGPESAKRHREEAERAHVPCHELRLPSLAIDVDTGEDIEAILRIATLGRRTREALEALGVAPR